MNKSRLIFLMLAVLIILTTVSGCGNNETSEHDTQPVEDTTATAVITTSEVADETIVVTEPENVTFTDNTDAAIPSKLTAAKIGDIDKKNITTGNSGIYYINSDGKYGIMTFDGSKDTGAIYTYCTERDKYFMVSKADSASVSDVKTMNCVGLVDELGNVVIPLEYASIKILSERYIQVYEVTEITKDKDTALVFSSDDSLAIFADDDDTFYNGNWYVYDLTTGKKLDGITGTMPYAISANGSFLSYRDDLGNKITVNDKGEALPAKANQLSDGYYYIRNDEGAVVYDAYQNKVFECKSDDYTPISAFDEYIIAVKYGDSTKYVLMDYNGKVVSAEFDNSPYVYEDLIFCNDTVYNFDGEIVFGDKVKYISYDKQLEKVYFLETESEFVLIQKDGTELLRFSKNEDISLDKYTYYSISKKVDGKNLCYCFNSRDYTIKGIGFAPWLIKTDTGITDVFSGDEIISGYESFGYTFENVNGEGIYVYAQNDKNGIDIYLVK